MDTGNLSNAFEIGDKRDPDVTIEMLDYKYINECSNVKVNISLSFFFNLVLFT